MRKLESIKWWILAMLLSIGMGASQVYADSIDMWCKVTDTNGYSVEKRELPIYIPEGKNKEIEIDIKEAGLYEIIMDYEWDYYSTAGNTIDFKMNNQTFVGEISGIWQDESLEKETDRYGNQITSRQIAVDGVITNYLIDGTNLVKDRFSIALDKGVHTIEISPRNYNLTLSGIHFVQKEDLALEEIPNHVESIEEMIVIEAENYVYKSDSYIRGENQQTPSVVPYDTKVKLINALDGDSFAQPSQKVMYEFEVKDPGYYYVGSKFKQDSKVGMNVYRDIEIDGQIMHKAFENVAFPYTRSKMQNQFVIDHAGNPIPIYLEVGKHTIAFTVTAEPVQEIIYHLNSLMDEINQAGVEMKKITGGNVDKNRTWDIQKYMPNIITDMERWIQEIDHMYEALQQLSGQKPGFANGLLKASEILSEALEEPRKLPSQATKIFEGSGSVAQIISDLISPTIKQPLLLDQIYITGITQLPKANASLVTQLTEEVKKFVMSFTEEAEQYSHLNGGGDALNIWVNRSIQYVEVLQQMADSYFTPQTGIPVEFSIMPSEQKLIMGNISGTAPDLAMGVSYSLPYEMALRGSVVDMYQFEDFLDFYSKEYSLEGLVPLWVDGKMSGVIETRDFNLLFYRKDILNELGVKVPTTWEEVKGIMPTLKRYAMNFHTTLSNGGGMKSLGAVAPFFYQNGADLYSQDGLYTAINTPQGEEAFTLMTDLFLIHSVATTTSNFYNEFRYGKTPIGISNLGTYTLLKYAAPEISGKWDVSLLPGVMDEEGLINRQVPSSDRACVILSGTDKQEEAWEFLKWWLSSETQIEYGFTMQTKFGSEFVWNTANLEAFEVSILEPRHREIVKEQWENSKEVARHPAGYMLEREISNAWNKVVIDGDNKRVSLDKAVITINREIQRKLEEFGYFKKGKLIKRKLEEFGYFKKGKLIKSYPIATVDKVKEGGSK